MGDVIFTALVAAAASIVTAVIAHLSTRGVKKSEAVENDASAAVQVAEAWAKLLDPLERRVKSLEDENIALRLKVQELGQDNTAKDKRIKELETEVAALQKELERFRPRRKTE